MMLFGSSEVDRVRDIDLHPDADAGILRRAKRQLSESLDDPSCKLGRVKAAAEAFATDAPSARALRAAKREAAASCAAMAQRAAETVEAAALDVDQRLLNIEDAVGDAVDMGVEAVSARAAAAVQSMHAHAVAAEQVIEQGVSTLQEQAVSAARASLWTAMSYVPRITWSSALGSSGRGAWSTFGVGKGSGASVAKPASEKPSVRHASGAIECPAFDDESERLNEENSHPQALTAD